MEYKYKYTDLTKVGYFKVKLTKKQHNYLFPKYQRKFGLRYEYYVDNKTIRIHSFQNWFSIFLNTILFPILVLYNGLSNFKETLREVSSLYRQKELGEFVERSFRLDSEDVGRVAFFTRYCKTSKR